jgi:hypothetical protein
LYGAVFRERQGARLVDQAGLDGVRDPGAVTGVGGDGDGVVEGEQDGRRVDVTASRMCSAPRLPPVA